MNKAGITQEEFNTAHEVLFRMNSEDFEKCFDLTIEFSFNYSEEHDLVEQELLLDSKTKVITLFSRLQKEAKTSGYASFLKRSNDENHLILTEVVSELLAESEKRDYPREYCFLNTIGGNFCPGVPVFAQPVQPIEFEGNTFQDATSTICGANFIPPSPPSDTDCDVIVGYSNSPTPIFLPGYAIPRVVLF